MRWVVGDRTITGSAASASQMGRFETKWLSRPDNLAALADLPGQWIDQVHQRRPPKMIVLDMDSSESPTCGEQEGSAYNGHFGCSCYHPLFVFNQLGDVERCGLRPGNVHSADGWRGVLEPVIIRYQGIVKRLYFRGDAAFRTWLVAITRNQAITRLRAERRRDHTTTPADDARVRRFVSRERSPEDHVLDRERRRHLAGCIEALPPRLRVALLLAHSGRSYKEMGALLGAPEGTIKSRVWEARRMVVGQLRAEDSNR